MVSSVKSLLPYHKHLHRSSAVSFYTRVFKTADLQCIWLAWIICVRQLYVSVGTRFSVCVTTIWSESETLRYHTQSALPGVSVSRCPGGGVSCQDLFPSGTVASHYTCTYISPWYKSFYSFVPITLTCINEQLSFDIRNMCRLVKYRLLLQFNMSNCAKLQIAQQLAMSLF